jgi:hypothetical protein
MRSRSIFVTFLFILACGEDPECAMPGTREPCMCENGRAGMRTCRDDGTLGACVCLEGGDAGPRRDGGQDAGTDAGSFDAAIPDGGGTDAGVIDAGREDAGRADAGRADAGRADAGRADAGRPDAGAPDAGGPDAGGPDAGEDAGP